MSDNIPPGRIVIQPQNESTNYSPTVAIISIISLIVGSILVTTGVTMSFGTPAGLITLGSIIIVFGVLVGYKDKG